MAKKISRSQEAWKNILTPEQFAICREKGTEAAFSGAYHHCKEPGTYHCVCCDAPLFRSETKFDSGTGWPSFYAPSADSAIHTAEDARHGMIRIEVLCAACDAHLGHLFPDGPPPTGERYCINSRALKLKKGK